MKFLKSSINHYTLNNKYSEGIYYTVPNFIFTANNKVFNYFQLQNNMLKRSYQLCDDTTLYKKLITLNTKKGFKTKTFHTYAKSISYVLDFFENFNHDLNNEYNTYNNFFEFSRNFPQEFYKRDFLIRYIYMYLELIFILKKIQPKKKTKKKKIVPKTLIAYIPHRNRLTTTLRILNGYINSSTTLNSPVRIGNALLYLVLSGKQSFLYKKKIMMYNKLLEKKKFY